MSDKNELTTETLTEPATDLTPKDLQVIQDYMDEGLPEVGTVSANDIARMMELYLSGRTYRQISMTMGKKKKIVLFLGHKFKWFDLRREYLEDLETNVRVRVIESKIVSQDFLLQMTHMWQKKIGSKMNRYFQSGDEQEVESIDLKEIDKYLKTVEILHRLDSIGGKTSQQAALGLNVGDGVTMKKISDKEFEITPKQKTVGNLLKEYADFAREQELQNKQDSINKNPKKDSKTKEEDDEDQ